MEFSRRFTRAGVEAYDGIRFTPRTSRIINPDGSVVFEAKDIMAPENWSQVAVDILAQKYFRKAGVPTHTKKIPEQGVPEWLQRSEPDTEKLEPLPETERFGSERDAPGRFPSHGGVLDVLGLETRLLSYRRRRPGVL